MRPVLLLVGAVVLLVVAVFVLVLLPPGTPRNERFLVVFAGIGAIAAILDWATAATGAEGAAGHGVPRSFWLSLRRTRPRPIKRYLIFVVNTGVGMAALFLVALPLLPASVASFLDQRGVLGPTTAHFLALVIVPYLSVLAVIFWVKSRSRHRKLLRIDKATASLNKTTHHAGRVRQDRVNSVNEALEHLLATTEKELRLTRALGSQESFKTAWIWLPDPTLTGFRAVHVVPSAGHGVYERMALEHRPKFWDRQSFDAIRAEWIKQRKGLRFAARRKLDQSTREELRQCGSLTGYIFDQEGPKAYKHADQCEVFDESYLELLAQKDRAEYEVRSAAGISLKVGNEKVGVLMLYDTAARGFLEADSTALRVWGQILAPFLAQNVQDSLYDDKEQIY